MKCMIFSLLSLPIVMLTAVFVFFVFTGCVHLWLCFRQFHSITNLPTLDGSISEQPVSIIICAHNEEHNLKNLLPKLLEQSYWEYEVIIGLDRCTDGSKKYLTSLNGPKVKFVEVTRTPTGWDHKKHILTQCVNQAKHEWLLLTDADCKPVSHNWISTFTPYMKEQQNLILGVSPYKPANNLVSLMTEYETFMTASNYLSEAANNRPYMGVGRNLMYRKSLFQQIDGFDEIQSITGGDDDLLIQKIGLQIRAGINIHQESLTYSAPERTWNKYLTQKIRHLSVGKHYQKKYKHRLSLQSGIHSSLWVSFLSLVGFSDNHWRIIVPFALLVLIKGLFFTKIAGKTGLPLRVAWYPIMDFMYAIFLPLVAIRAMLERNIRWKK